jgi:hypothetical protein
MVSNKSSDPYKQIIAALLSDVQTSHSEVFTPRSLRLTTQKVMKRIEREGQSFLTKTLPRLGKAFNRALSGEVLLNSAEVAFESLPNSKLPKFMGELFQLIFSHDGRVLPRPCVRSIKTLQQLLFVYYKYELPYDSDQEQAVLTKFERTEVEVQAYSEKFAWMANYLDTHPMDYSPIASEKYRRIVRKARILLSRVFASFDHRDIYPRHGPGAVATREQLWGKYRWTSISPRITETYPLDTYFYASMGHFCDTYKELDSLQFKENSARVLLVPKDSRGPRLISCEPLDFQWIQQGLGRAMSKHVELHPLTRYNIHFTDQQPNQFGALLGSQTGEYATLDLNEASDRVSVGLVRLLFPEPLLSALLNCRSQSTTLPCGRILKLNKYAPMGSALCFPVLALTTWAILAAGLSDACADRIHRKAILQRILVYGDDVIVPTAQAADAIKLLEAFGLKVNRDKSCISGFFRESCGMDAYKGVSVTPVRFRTVWSSSRRPESYVSWIAYANQLYDKKYYTTYNLIVGKLLEIYKSIPEMSMNLSCPSLREVPEENRPKYRRLHKGLQKLQWKVWDVRSRKVLKRIDGWSMLLRYFAEACSSTNSFTNDTPRRSGVGSLTISNDRGAFSVESYTKRRSNSLVLCWR